MRSVIGVWALPILFVATAAISQTEFSADVVDTQHDEAPILFKIKVTGDRVRIEPQPPVSGPTPGPAPRAFILINRHTQAGTVVMPAQREYIEAPAQMLQQYRPFFEPVDLETACVAWAQVPQHKGGICYKMGSEVVNGRKVIKYEGTSSSGDMNYFWLDQKLGLLVKWDDQISAGELRNFTQGPQPAGLFEVPADYSKSQQMFGVIQSAKPK